MNTNTSQSILIKRPYQSQHKRTSISNIFENTQNQSQQNYHRFQGSLPKIYDFIGPPQLRAQILQSHLKQSQVRTETLEQLQQKQKLGQLSRSMQTTIKQETVLSKFTGCQMKEYTRELRNMQYYKEYQNRWNKLTEKIKQHIPKGKQPTLLQRSKKHIVVLPNPQKDEILKNFVTSYWEKSLRNNDKSLTKHLKGHNRYKESQLEEMMQREDGVRQIQKSMPKLPVQELNKLSNRELVLSGRNKLASESMSCDPSIMSQFTSRRSRAMTDLPPICNSEVWRIQYDSSHKYIKDMLNY